MTSDRASEGLAATFCQWRQQAQAQANQADIPIAEVDWLLAEATGWTALDRLMNRPPARPCDLEWLSHIWQQRVGDRIPLQQLLQTVTWRQLQLTVTDAVLIPRPETEMLVDLAISWQEEFSAPGLWADLGTGSGAIAVGLAREIPEMSVVAIDASDAALQVAARNVERHGVGDRVTLLQGNWFEPLKDFLGTDRSLKPTRLEPTKLQPTKLQGAISNPPYIPTDVVEQLDPEVRDREPRMALDGGRDGLGALRHLVEAAPDYLQSGGCWLVEVMQGQAETVAELLAREGRYHRIAIHRDLDGVERAVSARRL